MARFLKSSLFLFTVVTLISGCNRDVDVYIHFSDGGMPLDDSSMPDMGSDAGEHDAGQDVGTDIGMDAGNDAGDTLRTGTVIKASGPALYYYAADGRRYVFPNEETYLSWYPDYSEVVTITDVELASIFIGGTLTFRPGTWLGKITTDPKIYAVTPGGILRWIQGEAIITALYGDRWNHGYLSNQPVDDVMLTQDIPDAFFVTYLLGTVITSPVHPDGTIIAYSGSPNCYLMDGGTKRYITEQGFEENRYNAAFILETTIQYPDGAPVTGYEAELAEPIYLD